VYAYRCGDKQAAKKPQLRRSQQLLPLTCSAANEVSGKEVYVYDPKEEIPSPLTDNAKERLRGGLAPIETSMSKKSSHCHCWTATYYRFTFLKNRISRKNELVLWRKSVISQES